MGNIDRNKLHSKLKMDITIWIPVLLTIITLATPALSSEPRVVCYYTNWSVYRPGTARFNPQNINPYLCTHLVYAFGGFTKDNTLKPFDKYQDIEKGGYAKFTGLKTYNKNLKTLLAIGGWNEGSSRFSPMVASRDRRKEFVRNAIKFLRQNRFDGLDLDWEYPAFRDGAKPKDRENYAKLVKELREEFERESEKTNKPRLLLTMAVPAGIEYIQKGFDVKTLNQYLDWMNLLTYDYHSAFEPAVNHHAPLYPLEEPNEYSVDNELNIDYTIKFYLENGADPDKLVLGIPTYGRSYTLFNPDANEIGSPADGPGEQGDATREKGYLAYYEICEALKPKERKRSISSDEDSDEDSEEEEDEPWTVMQPNPKAMGPVAFKGNQWVGYDDVDIVRKKAEYVVDNGLGGIMFWSIDNDDFRGSCHGKPYPLIEAAKEAYVHKLESSDKTVTSKPASASRPSNKRKNRPRSSTTTTTQKPTTKANKRVTSLTSTTPAWNIITPEPPTTPDPGSDFKCVDEGFFPHPRDCKKYFWCLDSGPSDLGIVAHQFTCPSGLFFNKAADSCDFARNVLCKMPSQTTKAPATTAAATRAPVTSTTTTTTTTRRPVKLSTRNSLLFRTTTTSTTTPEPESEEEYEDVPEDSADVDAEDPKVIKELIDLIKKVGGIEQLEKQLYRSESSASTDGGPTTTPSSFNKKLYQKVLERARGKNKFSDNSISEGSALNSRRGPQNAGLEASADKDRLLKKDRPQYTTINRQRTTYTNTQASESEEDEEEEEEEKQQASPTQRSRPLVDSKLTVATTTRSLQYVNIRRARPTTVSDAADDSDSRNALFERSEQSFLPTGSPNSLDIQSARRENIPEYVTIRRQRPTTEETTTVQYSEEDEGQATALEREISSQPQYTSIVRTRSTTTPAPEEPSSPEPTTVLAVQISSLLNSPSSEDESPEPETTQAQTTDAITTTTTTTTTTPAPSIAPPSPPRRTVLRRRGSTSTTTPSAPTSTTQQAPKRSFLRRTKATAPPDADTESPSLDTTTSKYVRRGGSKFNVRKEEAVEKNAVEQPSLSSNASGVDAAKRAERLPPRGFARRRPNTTVSASPPPATSSSAPPSRRTLFANRRRPVSSTTTTTTTTEAATTVTVDSEESLQDIGDTDIIEDPNLEPRAPKTSPKVQRRPLVSLKEEVGDQNPSATNEEERKRQSKKYSASIKQNQLDDLLKLKTKGQETTTEYRTTLVDDISAETALAIAAHQLLTAPVPSLQDYEQETRPHTTPDYKHTDSDSKDLQYPSTLSTDPYPAPTVEYVSTTQTVDTTQFTAPRIQTTTSNPSTLSNYSDLSGTRTPITTGSDVEITETPVKITSKYSDDAVDIQTLSTISRLSTNSNYSDTQTRSDVSKHSFENEVTNSPISSTYDYSDVTNRESLRKFSTEYDFANTLTPKAIAPTYTTSTYTADNDVTEVNISESPTRMPTFPSSNSDTERTFTLTPKSFSDREYGSPTTKYSTLLRYTTDNEVTLNFTPYASNPTATGSNEYYSTESSTLDDISPVVPRGLSRFSTSGLSTVKEYSDTPVRFVSRTSPSTILSPELTTSIDTSTQDYSTDTFAPTAYNPPKSSVNTPEIASTDYSNAPTELNAPSTFARKPSTFGIQAFTNANVVTSGLSGVSQSIGSTARFTTTERSIRIPVQGYDYSTFGYTGAPSSRNPEPAYFTREYLLESPVTKTYDDEYQYLSPITTPTTSTTTHRRIIRKKLQRRISTTARPTTAIASRVTTQYLTTTQYLDPVTTPKPRRVPTKKPFEKILKDDPPKTFRPIVNYDYYDDSEEKVAEKYVEGTKVVLHSKGVIECLDTGNFPHPSSCKKFISCARMEGGALLGWEYICPKGLSFDPVGAICNWSAGLGCDEKDV